MKSLLLRLKMWLMAFIEGPNSPSQIEAPPPADFFHALQADQGELQRELLVQLDLQGIDIKGGNFIEITNKSKKSTVRRFSVHQIDLKLKRTELDVQREIERLRMHEAENRKRYPEYFNVVEPFPSAAELRRRVFENFEIEDRSASKQKVWFNRQIQPLGPQWTTVAEMFCEAGSLLEYVKQCSSYEISIDVHYEVFIGESIHNTASVLLGRALWDDFHERLQLALPVWFNAVQTFKIQADESEKLIWHPSTPVVTPGVGTIGGTNPNAFPGGGDPYVAG